MDLSVIRDMYRCVVYDCNSNKSNLKSNFTYKHYKLNFILVPFFITKFQRTHFYCKFCVSEFGKILSKANAFDEKRSKMKHDDICKIISMRS